MKPRYLLWQLPLLLLCAAVVLIPVAMVGVARTNPPRVTDFQPAGGRDVSLRNGVRLTFDQPMQRASVEQAFEIEPALDGAFSWSGNTLQFQPREAAPAETTFTVRLAASARSLTQQTLPRPFF